MKFVDISGFGHSGKGVVTDLLREFEGYNVPHPNFEFNLFRIQGGLIDLQHGLIDNWSPIRADAALKRFIKLVNRIGPRASFRDPKSLFMAIGMNYDSYFNGMFSKISQSYVQSLITYSYQTDWPYPIIEESPLKQFNQRLQAKLKLVKRTLPTVLVTSLQREDFIAKTQQYISNLFEQIKKPSDHTMVMHNAFEPYEPLPAMKLVPSSKLIVVQRDPRDIYASTIVGKGGYVPNYEDAGKWELKRTMLSIDNVDTFCLHQLTNFNHVEESNSDHILRLRYEDIILDYEATLKKIYTFLGEDSSIHIDKKKYFRPELSAKNIGLWKKLENSPAIKKIEDKLAAYCFNVS